MESGGWILTHAQSLYRECGIGELWLRKKLEDFHGDKEALEATKKFIAGSAKHYKEGRGLCYIGANGVGKTFLMMEVCKAAIDDERNVYVTSLTDIVEMFTGGFYNDKEKRRYKDLVLRVDLLGIDDVGKEFRPKSGMIEILFDNILRKRRQRMKSVVMTTNLSPNALAATYGQSVASLLNESIRIIKVEGKDFRKEMTWTL